MSTWQRVPNSDAMTDEPGLRLRVASSPSGTTHTATVECPPRGVSFTSAKYNYYNTVYGSSVKDRDGFVKVLAAPDTGESQGAHIIGTDAVRRCHYPIPIRPPGVAGSGPAGFWPTSSQMNEELHKFNLEG